MAKSMIGWMMGIIIVQLFFSLGITMITYSMPDSSTSVEATSYTDITKRINLTSVGNDIEGGLTQQTSIPVIELGALVFYSGNILIDLLLNFIFALPEMAFLLMSIITNILGIDNFLMDQIQIFTSVLIFAIYFIGVIQLLTGIRSGRIT